MGKALHMTAAEQNFLGIPSKHKAVMKDASTSVDFTNDRAASLTPSIPSSPVAQTLSIGDAAAPNPTAQNNPSVPGAPAVPASLSASTAVATPLNTAAVPPDAT